MPRGDFYKTVRVFLQGCQSGAMALKTAPVKISWRQGLLLNCLTALSGHATNARCSTVAPRRREGGIYMHHGHTYLRSQIRAHAHTAGDFFACAAPETVLALHFRPQRKLFLTPLFLVHCELFPMEPNSAGTLRKVCPLCNITVHVRRAVCGCGYAFPSKRRARPDSVLQAMKHERVHVRASETPVQTVNRKEQDKLRKSSKRASETTEQTVNRKEQDKLRKSSKRASETTEQTMNRQEQNRAHMASMRASETPEQTGNRQEQNRLHKVNVRASETPVQTGNRYEQNRLHKVNVRASETPEQTGNRQEQNRLHKVNVRASETPEQTGSRQEQNRLHKVNVRASETPVQTVNRQEQNRLHKVNVRASETPEQTVNRQEQNRLHQARKRALETPEEVLQRKKADKEHRSCKRSKTVSVEEVISAVHSETRAGSDFVCTCCHHMVYRKSVV